MLAKVGYTLCVSALLGTTVLGQETGIDPWATSNTVYLSLYGQGMLYSVNFDRAWYTATNGMSVSIGMTYLPDIGSDSPTAPPAAKFSVPVQWNWFHGDRSTMERGLGLSLLSGWNSVGEGYDGTGPAHSTSLHAFIKPIGYRLQPKRSGFFLRAYPLVGFKLMEFNDAWRSYIDTNPSEEESIFPWFGLDLGYSF